MKCHDARIAYNESKVSSVLPIHVIAEDGAHIASLTPVIDILTDNTPLPIPLLFDEHIAVYNPAKVDLRYNIQGMSPFWQGHSPCQCCEPWFTLQLRFSLQ